MQKIVKLNQAFLYCCMVVMFCLHSQGYAAPTQGKPVSINIKNSTLAEILRQVSKKSGLYIYFQDADLAAHKNVTIDVRNKPVENVLHELLDGRGLSWVEVSENTIAVKKKEVDILYSANSDSTITVFGKVLAENGSPLEGATVLLKNSKIGTTTKSTGEFEIHNANPNSILVISNVSFFTQEVAIKGRKLIGDIRLKQYVGLLDEIQVQAYGTTSRRDGTGNISTVKASDISKSPVSNPLLSIQGRMAGVFIEQSNGVPGSNIKIRIQGQNSMSSGNEPFYVVDGVPYTAQLLPNISNELAGGSPLNFINPQDIESIDVLKDADATAIYGSRAANGAILITTKKGKAGKTAVQINVQNGWGKVTRKLDMLNTQQYLQMREEAFVNDGLDVPNSNTPVGQMNTSNYDLTFWSKNRYTNWQKELIGGTSSYTNAQFSISGGNENTQFLFGGGYQRETTVTPADLTDKKASVHLNVQSASSNQRFKFSFSGNYMSDRNRLSGGIQNLSFNAFYLPPNAPNLYNADGTLNWQPNINGISTFTNPLAILNNSYLNKTRNLVVNSILGYEILPNLIVKSNFGYSRLESDEITTAPSTITAPERRATYSPSASFGTSSIGSWIIEPQISYGQKIGSGYLDALFGSSFQQEDRNRLRLNASGYSSDLTLENIKAASNVVVDGAGDATIISRYKYNAMFSRISYNWQDRYIVSFNLRRDGSSRFGTENKFQDFYSIAGAWLFSNELFVKRNVNFLSFGKIRVSYGTTGNDQIGDYQYLNLYNSTADGGVPYQGVKGIEPQAGFPNPYLQWEETQKFSYSLDLGFLDDKFLINATYYRNRSSNQLLSLTLPTITGGTEVATNRPAVVQNNGWEFVFTSNNFSSKGFNWSTNINLTLPKNKLLEYTGSDRAIYEYAIGKPLGILRVYEFGGVDHTNGSYLFVDRDGKPTSMPNPDFDKTQFVDFNPKYYGGIQNSFKYKSFSLDILLQFVKQVGQNNYFGNGSSLPGRYGNQLTTVLGRWRRVGDMTSIARYNSNNTLSPQYRSVRQSDRAYSDASYVRLKNISFSWYLPEHIVKRAKLQSARLFIQGQNIFTITGYSGLDPETKTLSGLPPLRILTVGFQLTL